MNLQCCLRLWPKNPLKLLPCHCKQGSLPLPFRGLSDRATTTSGSMKTTTLNSTNRPICSIPENGKRYTKTWMRFGWMGQLKGSGWEARRKSNKVSFDERTSSESKVLLRHYLDLDHNFFRAVCQLMWHNYEYSKRVQERAQREAGDLGVENNEHKSHNPGSEITD